MARRHGRGGGRGRTKAERSRAAGARGGRARARDAGAAPDDVLAALDRLVRDPSADVRRAAVQGLLGAVRAAGVRGEHVATRILLRALRDEDPSVRHHAACAVEYLEPLGIVPSPRLGRPLAALLESDPVQDVRIEAARALRHLRARSRIARVALAAAVEKAPREVAVAALEALDGVALSSATRPRLVELLSVPSSAETARAALEAAGLGRSADVRAAVAGLLRDTRVRLRRAVRDPEQGWDLDLEDTIRALGRDAACLTLPLLRADPATWWEIGSAFEQMGGRGLRALRRALAHRSPMLRARAAAAIGKLGETGAPLVPDLVAATHDADARVREAAAAAIGAVRLGWSD